MNSQFPVISIVICSHNRAFLLEKCLNHIKRSTANIQGKVELIVVDNASTDKTNEVVSNFVSNNLLSNLEVLNLYEPKLGKSTALLTGMKKITGDYVQFIDDDNIMNDETLMILHKILAKYPDHLIGSKNIAVFDSIPPYWFEEMQSAYACGEPSPFYQLTGAVWGAGMVCPSKYIKKLIQSNFQFASTCRKGKSLGSGSDLELSFLLRIMGLEVVHPEEYTLEHFMLSDRLSLSYLARLYYNFGKSDPLILPYKVFMRHNTIVEYPSKKELANSSSTKIKNGLKKMKIVQWRKDLPNITYIIYHVGYLYSSIRNYDKILPSHNKIMKICSEVSSSRLA